MITERQQEILDPYCLHVAAAVSMTSARTIDIELTLANVADTVTVNRVEVFLMR